jgi:hypothetical protein
MLILLLLLLLLLLPQLLRYCHYYANTYVTATTTAATTRITNITLLRFLLLASAQGGMCVLWVSGSKTVWAVHNAAAREVNQTSNLHHFV